MSRSTLVACAHAGWEAGLARWAERRWPEALRAAAPDADALARHLATFSPEAVVLEFEPALLEAWRRAGSTEAALWLALAEPRAQALAAAVAMRPAGLLTLPLGAALVAGLPPVPPAGSPGAHALLAQARALALAPTGGRHWKWLQALCAVLDGQPEAWGLLAPGLAEHVFMEAAERAPHGPDAAPDLASLVVPVACRVAAAGIDRDLRVTVGALGGAFERPFGPAYRLLGEAATLLAASLPPGSALSFAGEGGSAPRVRVTRAPSLAPEPAPELHFAGLFERAREAEAGLSLDEAAWPVLTVRFEAPAPPLPAPVPRTVVLEPDPLIRAWLREQPGGRSLALPPWQPSEPLPQQASAEGALVVVDQPFVEAVRAALGPAGTILAEPFRARFGEGTAPALFTPVRAQPGVPAAQVAAGIAAGEALGEAPAPSRVEPAEVEGRGRASAPEQPSARPAAPAPARRGAMAALAALAAAAGLVGGLVVAGAGGPEPPASREAAGPAAPREVVVDLASRTLAVREGPHELLRLPVAVGEPQHPTPEGRFKVTIVAADPPYFKGKTRLAPYRQDRRNPLGTRWIGLNTPGIGLHGTADPASIGRATTDGCVRLTNAHAELLAAHVKPGTPVVIRGR